MSYKVELSKAQDVLVKELFNYFNGTEYDIIQLSLEGTPTALTVGAYNTVQDISIAPLPSGVDVGQATIYYNRIDIGTLFSIVEVELREIDVMEGGGACLINKQYLMKCSVNIASIHQKIHST